MITILLLLSLFTCPVQAVENLPELLDAYGYTEDSFEIALAWEEIAQNGSGVLVSGVRLLPRNGEPAFDLYFDESGGLLNDVVLTELGIDSKDWAPGAVVKDAEYDTGPVKKEETPVFPAGTIPKQEFVLPPIDEERILLEDEAAKRPERIGVHRMFDSPITVLGNAISDGQWEKTGNGGLVWSVAVRSMGAFGIRVHFDTLLLPSGARLILYNGDDPAEAYGPFDATGDFWSPTCFGEAVVLECYLAPGVSPDKLEVSVDRITHNFKGIDEYLKGAGSCNLDVACYSSWQEASWAVGGIGTIGSTGVLWCTGSLLADNDPDSTVPYFLTANHCVSSSYEANTIEVYWLYQRSSCSGSVPSILSVSRTTGGAEYLAGNTNTTGTDFAFLRLRNQPSASVAYLGFETSSAAVGTAVTCIHHPSGDYKRISFGNITDDGSPEEGGARLKPITRFHEVLWNTGTTEGGSSGSPLMIQGTQRVIGQLYGGHAACYATDEPDYFGRFDVTYPLIANRLGSPYDVNRDGSVNDDDLALVVNAALRRANVSHADVNDSGAVDSVDLQLEAVAVSSG
ncbi:MAG TPA: trypsin-like peptidase domain-containing protein [Candidatus Hydrogenedentes bacterium]|nr:trypsin-like peptidase domain-containing protein [Candidatus Hydrogenedentota bacterium]